MKKVRFLALVTGLMLLGTSTVFALTAQDKESLKFTTNSELRTAVSGTALSESASDTSIDGHGDQTLTLGTVGTDKLWHVTGVAYTYVGTTTNVRPVLLVNGKTYDQMGAPTTNEANSFTVDMWVGEGDTVQIEFPGYTVGDSIYGYLNGLEYYADQ